MKFIYQIFIYLLKTIFSIGRFFSSKIRKGWQGRQQSLRIVKAAFSKEDKVIWMHAASLGEYEQGLPVLEAMKQRFPDHKILVTFFSPSGYEVVAKKHHIADVVCYLPWDTPKEISLFINSFNTDIFFTVKYDYWYHLLQALKAEGTKIYVISALFYPSQIFFKSYGQWFLSELRELVDWFFHQTKASMDLACSVGLTQSSISGDTRFDRVKEIKKQRYKVPYIKAFKAEGSLVVFGSSWEAEERIAQYLSQDLNVKILLAPHNLKHVARLKQFFPKALLYSELNENMPMSLLESSQILIIDSVGWLSRIYAYADIAVVGGGFHTAGLHNILEAATYGVPVLFGNQYKKNPEADALITFGGGQSFHKEKEMVAYLRKLLRDDALLRNMSMRAEEYIQQQPNATQLIIEKIDTIKAKSTK